MSKQTFKTNTPVEELKGQLSASEVTELKKIHGNLYAIQVGGHIAYFRSPTRNDVNASAALLDPDTPLEYFSQIMKDCKVGGSDDVLIIDELFLGAMKEFKPLIEGAKATLVKL